MFIKDFDKNGISTVNINNIFYTFKQIVMSINTFRTQLK